MTDDDSLRSKITRQGEDALGKVAQELLENPLVTGALQRAFEAREKATQAQEVAMGALNLPSAADLERLTRRLRSVSQRLEGIEDGLDRIDDRVRPWARARVSRSAWPPSSAAWRRSPARSPRSAARSPNPPSPCRARRSASPSR